MVAGWSHSAAGGAASGHSARPALSMLSSSNSAYSSSTSSRCISGSGCICRICSAVTKPCCLARDQDRPPYRAPGAGAGAGRAPPPAGTSPHGGARRATASPSSRGSPATSSSLSAPVGLRLAPRQACSLWPCSPPCSCRRRSLGSGAQQPSACDPGYRGRQCCLRGCIVQELGPVLLEHAGQLRQSSPGRRCCGRRRA